MRTCYWLLLTACLLGLEIRATAADLVKNLTTFKDNGMVASAVVFTPDGKSVVTGYYTGDERFAGQVKIWDLATGKPKGQPLRFVTGVNTIAISPDGKLMAVGANGFFQGAVGNPFRVVEGDLKLFDMSGKARMALKSPSLDYWCAVFSPDGKTLATSSGHFDNRGRQLPGGVIRLWDVAKGKESASLLGHKGIVQAVAWSPDGKALASASRVPGQTPNAPGSGELKLWDAATGKEKASLEGHGSDVWCVAFSPDGSLIASGSQDNTVRLWDLSTAKEVALLKGHANVVSALAFSPDGKLLATGGGDPGVAPTPGELKLWDVAGRKELASLKGFDDTVMSLAFDAKGKTLVTACRDGTVKLWDVSGLADR